MSPAARRGPPTSGPSRRNARSTPASRLPTGVEGRSDRAGAQPVAHAAANMLQQVLDAFTVREKPVRLRALCGAGDKTVPQIPEAVHASTPHCGPVFRELDLLQVVTELVFFSDQQLDDRCPVCGRNVMIPEEIEIM